MGGAAKSSGNLGFESGRSERGNWRRLKPLSSLSMLFFLLCFLPPGPRKKGENVKKVGGGARKRGKEKKTIGINSD